MRRLLFPLLLAAAAPAHAEVVEKSDNGFLIRQAVELPVDQWEAWKTLIAPAKWWSAEHTWSGKAENLYLDSQATGCFCELMPVPDGAPEGTRRGSVEHMRLIHVNPGRVLRMKGALGPLQSEPVQGVMTITLKPQGKGTRLLLEYAVGGTMRYKVDEIGPAVDKVLGQQVASLGKLLGVVEKQAEDPKAEDKPAAAGDQPAGAEAAPAAEGDVAAEFDASIKQPAKPKAKVQPKPAAKPAVKKPAAD